MPAARVEARRLDLELLHRARRGHERDAAAAGHVGRAVERELVAADRAAADHVGRAAVVERPGELQIADVGHAGRQARQREGVAVGQRHHRDRLLGNRLSGRAGGRRQQRRLRRHRHRLLHPADVEREVDVDASRRCAPRCRTRHLLEAGEFRDHRVGAGIQEQDLSSPLPRS